MKKYIAILVFISVPILLFLAFSKKPNEYFEGMVYDCETNQPISNARVLVYMGNDIWHLFSDSGRSWEGQTNTSGYFSIPYAGGIANVSVGKDEDNNYLVTSGVFLGGKTKIGMMKKKPDDAQNEFIVAQCQKSSTCIETKMVDGIMVSNNTCSNTLPQI